MDMKVELEHAGKLDSSDGFKLPSFQRFIICEDGKD